LIASDEERILAMAVNRRYACLVTALCVASCAPAVTARPSQEAEVGLACHLAAGELQCQARATGFDCYQAFVLVRETGAFFESGVECTRLSWSEDAEPVSFRFQDALANRCRTGHDCEARIFQRDSAERNLALWAELVDRLHPPTARMAVAECEATKAHLASLVTDGGAGGLVAPHSPTFTSLCLRLPRTVTTCLQIARSEADAACLPSEAAR
jgi:hypothetical protein